MASWSGVFLRVKNVPLGAIFDELAVAPPSWAVSVKLPSDFVTSTVRDSINVLCFISWEDIVSLQKKPVRFICYSYRWSSFVTTD